MPSDADNTIDSLLTEGFANPKNWDALLAAVLARFDCTTGTIHVLDSSELLQLAAHRGIPEELIPVVTTIPLGKGIAGAAAETREAVQLCNLQTDDTGVVRPDAKKTKVVGSVAIPLERGETLCGTLGIGKYVPYDFTEPEIEAAIRLLFEQHRLVVEGSGALGVGALLKRKDQFKGKKVVAVVCGRNIDLEVFKKIIA